MTDAIDDFHDLKELLHDEGFAIHSAEFDHDAEGHDPRRFSVELDLTRFERDSEE